MSMQGFALLIWDAPLQEWASLACSTDRERLEHLAERLREIAVWPSRVVEVLLLDDDMIQVLRPESVGEVLPADVFTEYGDEFGHEPGSAES